MCSNNGFAGTWRSDMSLRDVSPNLRPDPTNQPFVKYFYASVERSAPADLFTRSLADTRPSSIAFPRSPLRTHASGGVATVSPTRNGPTRFETTGYSGSLPYCPVGDRRQSLTTKRLAKDHYTFTSATGQTVDVGVGLVHDDDTIGEVVDKLGAKYPELAPTTCGRGGGALFPVAPRRVRTSIVCRGKMLLEAEPIGQQCLRLMFDGQCSPSVERATRLDLAARARQEAAPSSVAYLEPYKLKGHCTFLG
mmetsp:Transcript_20919/g.45478  ORF Transcript_20919/g.45478 Transcript_20919/m.45478 type:complete len:250 (+) Transcript_20919:195-944(+)